MCLRQSLKLIFISILFFVTTTAFAQTYSVPSTSTTGVYVVSYSTPSTYALIDELVDGSWRTIGGGNANGSLSVTKTVNGTYTYRMQNCIAGQFGQSCTIVSGTKSIVVNISGSGGGGTGTTPPVGATPASPPTDSGSTIPVGTLSANFRVSESGAATYNIPINVADGIAGVKPQLSVMYSSQGGNGLLGVGANLAGVSAISRCRQTLLQDGVTKPIQWNSEDRFCLNGQRLMLVSGSYGTSGSTYKTEIDSYAIITAMGGTAGNPDYFIVEAKDGSKTYFGYDDEAANSSKVTVSSGQHVSWGQSLFMDNMQNRIHYIYESGKVLKEIAYAYPLPFVNGTALARVQFFYETRGDKSTSFLTGGFSITSENRLQYIRVYSKQNGYENLIRKYEFRYTTGSSGLSRLSAASECMSESSSNCYRETTFSWQDPQFGFDSAEVVALISDVVDFKTHIFMDVNGDGQQELVWISSSGNNRYIKYATIANDCPPVTGGGLVRLVSTCSHIDVKLFSNNSNKLTYTAVTLAKETKLSAIDYNADGRQDLLVWKPANANSVSAMQWHLYLSVPDMNGGWQLSGSPITMPFSAENIKIGDFNADGLVDAYTESGGGISVYKLQKSGAAVSSNQYYSFQTSPTIYPLVGLPAAGVGWGMEGLERYGLADFNGDGLLDLLYDFTRYANPCSANSSCAPSPQISELLVLINNGSQLVVDQNYTRRYSVVDPVYGQSCSPCYPSTFYLESFMMPDLNGDGLTDLVYYDNRYSSGTWYYLLNNGKSFSGGGILSQVAYEFNNQYQHSPMFFDYNQDGYADVIWHNKDQQYLGYKLWNPATNSFAAEQVLPGGMGSRTSNFVVGDLNGDSVADIYKIRVSGSSLEFKLSAGIKHVNDNKIFQIVDGVGKTTDIEYGSMSNTAHYLTIKAPKSSYSFNQCFEPQDANYGTCEFAQVYETSTANFYTQLNDPFPTNREAYTSSPILNIATPMAIVTQVNSSAPTTASANNKVSVSYWYYQARIQAGGRGFLGFKKLITRDLQSGILTETQYEQGWPYNGAPSATVTRSRQGKTLSSASSTWANEKDAINNRIRRVFLDLTSEVSYSLKDNGATQGAVLQTVTTNNDYDPDGYGNITKIVTTTSGSSNTSTKTIDNIYPPSGWERRMGRLKTSTTTTQRNSETPVIRVSQFEYYPETDFRKGLLWKEIIEPGSNAFTTEYDYDLSGNQTSVKKTAFVKPGVSQERKTTTSYDANRRYIAEVRDGMGNIVSGVIDRHPVFSSPTKIRDTNNVITEIIYNDFDGTEKQRKDATGAWVHTKKWYCDSTQCPGLPLAKYKLEKWVSGGGRTIEYMDVLGRNIRTSQLMFDGSFTHVDTEYDTRGLIARKSEPYATTANYWTYFNSYDILGRPLQATMPNNSVVTTSYDGYKTIKTADSTGKALVTTEERNSLGNLVKVTDNLNGTVSYGYDVLGNLTSVTTSTASGDKTVKIQMCYDKYSRKIAMHDPDKGGFLGNANATCDQVDDYVTSPASSKLAGWWYYQYNDFGELIEQTDTKKQVTSMDYDSLGRMTTRTNRFANGLVDAHTSWFYDRPYGTSGTYTNYQGKVSAVVNSYGQISSACSGSNYCQTYTYDSASRVTDTVTYLPNSSVGYINNIKYDSIGRVDEVRDVLSGLIGGATSGIKNMYNANGYTGEVRDLATGDILQKTMTTNERGQVTRELRLNGGAGEVINDYFPQTGLIKSTKASIAGASFAIQDITYDWDAVGNLKSRWNQSSNIGRTAKKNLQESFCYDGLNRLIKSHLGTTTGSCSLTASTQDQEYDGLGNITRKVDVGTYVYGSNAGPHAVTSITGVASYSYDGNGNNTQGSGSGFPGGTGGWSRTISYTSYDMAQLISTPNRSSTTEFKYGPDRARYEQIKTITANGQKTLTQYFGNVERIEVIGSNVVEWKRYIAGAVYTLRTTATNCGSSICYALQRTDKSFIYNDHLGSLDVVVNNVGTITHTASFDAWGNRRSGETWVAGSFAMSSLTLTNYTQPITTRGFTGHEMLDDAGLIHMNGRVYDAKLARFIQADPFIQAATDTQNYNRYSYIRNNPLNATDPSGFFWERFWKNAWEELKPYVSTIVTNRSNDSLPPMRFDVCRNDWWGCRCSCQWR